MIRPILMSCLLCVPSLVTGGGCTPKECGTSDVAAQEQALRNFIQLVSNDKLDDAWNCLDPRIQGKMEKADFVAAAKGHSAMYKTGVWKLLCYGQVPDAQVQQFCVERGFAKDHFAGSPVWQWGIQEGQTVETIWLVQDSGHRFKLLSM